MLAGLHSKLGNTEDAITQWRQAVEGYRKTGTILDDELEKAVLSLARLYEITERYDDEVFLWDRVLNDFKREGEGLELHYFDGKLVRRMESLARQFDNMARYDDAVAQWKRAIELAMVLEDYDDVCEYVGSLADLFHRLGRDNDAVAQCESAVKWIIEENFVVVRNLAHLARQIEKLGQYDKAVPVWKKLIRRWNTNYYNEGLRNPIRPLAEALDKMGQYKKAAIQWERAFKWDDPDFKTYSVNVPRDDEDRLFEMMSAANAYAKAGLIDKAEAIREKRRKWEEHLRWYDEMEERGEDVEIDWDILGTDQEDGDEDDEVDEE